MTVCVSILVRIVVLSQEGGDIGIVVGHPIVELDGEASGDMGRVVQALLGPCTFAIFAVAIKEAEGVAT
jgi:hypothetical protein